MKQELNISDLITDYQNSAQRVVEIFKRKYSVENILEGWHSGIYEQTGKIPEEGLKFYACHGIGIAAHFTDKLVDFDFAYLPELRYDGFDLWRLTSFVKSQPEKYSLYLNNKLLESEFERLKKEMHIYNPKTEFPTNLYFWTKDLNKNQINHVELIRNNRTKSWWKFW